MTFLVLLVALLVAGLGLGWVIARQVHVCTPNEVLLMAGGRGVGAAHGYRSVRGARTLRLPVIERAFRLDLTSLTLDVVAVGHSRDAIVERLGVVVAVRIGAEEPTLGRAAECLLGKSRERIADLARMVVRGEATALLAELTSEQVTESPEEVADRLRAALEAPLARIGLELASLKIGG